VLARVPTVSVRVTFAEPRSPPSHGCLRMEGAPYKAAGPGRESSRGAPSESNFGGALRFLTPRWEGAGQPPAP
jgi:hypothetical protein